MTCRIVQHQNNTVYYNSDDEYHREDGPAIIMFNGEKHWLIHGIRHREDGPAVVYADGSKEWWINGKRHRIDGPAIEYSTDGRIYYYEYWINGVDITEEVDKWREEIGITNIYLTPEQATLFVLYFGNVS